MTAPEYLTDHLLMCSTHAIVAKAAAPLSRRSYSADARVLLACAALDAAYCDYAGYSKTLARAADLYAHAWDMAQGSKEKDYADILKQAREACSYSGA